MKPRRELSVRHRIVIAAAVTAAVGRARIREIRPAAWTRRSPGVVRGDPYVPRSHETPVAAEASE